MKRLLVFGILLALLLLYAGLVTFAPIIGLDEKYDYFLLRLIGMDRGQILAIPLVLSFILVVYLLLGIGVEAPDGGWRLVAVLKSAWADGTVAAREFLNETPSHHLRERWIVVALIAAFGSIFAIFLWKTLIVFFNDDQLWSQTFVDYDIDWGTPFFSLGANVLYNFGIQVPLNTHLLPLERIAHAFPPEHRILATVALCFLAVGGLFYAIGGKIGLRPIPRTIFAGAVALLATIPRGLNVLIWLLPPYFFTSLFTGALWWLEGPILFLTSVFLFFWLGQRQSLWGNIATGVAFAAGAFTVVLSYPFAAIYLVFLTALYCLGFALTCESRYEFAWKAGVSIALGGFMVLARVPQFFIGLYSYTFGSYFFELLRVPTADLISDGFLINIFDIRVLLVFTVSMGAAAVVALKSKTPARRIAIAALLCEGAIVLAGLINALTLRAPMMVWYAEIAHSPVWGAYFILFGMVLAIVVDRRISELSRHAVGRISTILESAFHRRVIYLAGLFIVMAGFAAFQARSSPWTPYPPFRPKSLELVAREVAIAPGQPFRGRLLLTGVPNQEEQQVQHVAAALGVPTSHEYKHWTSPVSFVFLRSFFAKPDDFFEKASFWLYAFDLRVARLMGVRMVLTDAKEIPGGTPIYETKSGDADLRIFRIDDINVGQYSPTRPRRVSTAAEAISELRVSDFDPKRDAVVEDAIPSGLVPAIFAKVTVDLGPTLVVQAFSPGRSLLVLPFEYSHCLHLDIVTGGARLIPVNLQQTGLLFEGSTKARITFRFGLFGDAACRGDDVRRADGLNLRGALGPYGSLPAVTAAQYWRPVLLN